MTIKGLDNSLEMTTVSWYLWWSRRALIKASVDCKFVLCSRNGKDAFVWKGMYVLSGRKGGLVCFVCVYFTTLHVGGCILQKVCMHFRSVHYFKSLYYFRSVYVLQTLVCTSKCVCTLCVCLYSLSLSRVSESSTLSMSRKCSYTSAASDWMGSEKTENT